MNSVNIHIWLIYDKGEVLKQYYNYNLLMIKYLIVLRFGGCGLLWWCLLRLRGGGCGWRVVLQNTLSANWIKTLFPLSADDGPACSGDKWSCSYSLGHEPEQGVHKFRHSQFVNNEFNENLTTNLILPDRIIVVTIRCKSITEVLRFSPSICLIERSSLGIYILYLKKKK